MNARKARVILARRRMLGQASDSDYSYSLWDDLYGGATGNVPADVVQQIAQSSEQQNVQAGGAPDPAATQALINATLAKSAVRPGAFGINWQGALPEGPNWVTQLEQNVADSASAVVQGQWLWWALGGVGLLFLLSRK